MTGACPKCGDPFAPDDLLVPVGMQTWHQTCALGHLIEQLQRPVEPEPILYTPAQASRMLGIGVDSVHRFARSGALGHVTLTRPGVDEETARRAFRREHLDEFIAAREHAAEPDKLEEALSPRRRRVRPTSEAQEQHGHLVPRSRRQDRTAHR